MSRRIAVDQNVCGGMADTQGWQFKICEVCNNWECASSRKFSFYYLAVICTNTGRTEQIQACVCAVMINPPELPINDEAHTASSLQVCTGISTKNETGNYWYIKKSAKSSTLK